MLAPNGAKRPCHLLIIWFPYYTYRPLSRGIRHRCVLLLSSVSPTISTCFSHFFGVSYVFCLTPYCSPLTRREPDCERLSRPGSEREYKSSLFSRPYAPTTPARCGWHNRRGVAASMLIPLLDFAFVDISAVTNSWDKDIVT